MATHLVELFIHEALLQAHTQARTEGLTNGVVAVEHVEKGIGLCTHLVLPRLLLDF